MLMRDDGVLYLCELINTAAPGSMPRQELWRVARFWYAERTVGYNRLYAARGVNEDIDMLVRVAFTKAARAGMYALLGNGEQYRINGVQQVRDDETGLRATDLTLQRVEDYFDVEENDHNVSNTGGG